jgi:hypothetical protein
VARTRKEELERGEEAGSTPEIYTLLGLVKVLVTGTMYHTSVVTRLGIVVHK